MLFPLNRLLWWCWIGISKVFCGSSCPGMMMMSWLVGCEYMLEKSGLSLIGWYIIQMECPDIGQIGIWFENLLAFFAFLFSPPTTTTTIPPIPLPRLHNIKHWGVTLPTTNTRPLPHTIPPLWINRFPITQQSYLVPKQRGQPGNA